MKLIFVSQENINFKLFICRIRILVKFVIKCFKEYFPVDKTINALE